MGTVINEKVLTKHMLNSGRVIIERKGDHYWVADGCAMFRLPVTTEAFNDRTAYPELPDNGQSLHYDGKVKGRTSRVKHGSDVRRDPGLAAIVPLYDRTTDRMTVTNLIFLGDDGDIRLGYTHGRIVPISNQYISLIATMQSVQFYQHQEHGPIVVESDDDEPEPVAVIMPLMAPDNSPALRQIQEIAAATSASRNDDDTRRKAKLYDQFTTSWEQMGDR